MKITSAEVSLASQQSYQKTTSSRENLDFWVGDPGRDRLPPETIALPAYSVDISDYGKQLSTEKASSPEEFRITLSEKDKQLIALLEAFFERLTGKKTKFMVPKDEDGKGDYVAGPSFNRPLPISGSNSAGWGLRYERHETIRETESVSFTSSGSVKTADGRSIDFALDLNMSRSFISENHLEVRGGDALKDPLVLNFGRASASMTNEKISIDIDNDGDSEAISNLAEGSGFLAFDKNGDGAITSGSELFGPESGNGFEDLMAYDTDGNQWIDENDGIFDKLRIWTVNEKGESSLIALGEKGIGAIYLGSVSTGFDLNVNTNTEGRIRRTGIFLNENGSASTIQHVDLKI